MNAVPDEALLAHLRTQYTAPDNAQAGPAAEDLQAQDTGEVPEAQGADLEEGCEEAREAARQMLGALALAENPRTASVPEVFAAFRLVHELSFASAIPRSTVENGSGGSVMTSVLVRALTLAAQAQIA
jgi:hypothetical protein